MKTFAKGPSNIAVIKYMGKEKEGKNIPTNPSLSMTLNSLCTLVELRTVTGDDKSVHFISEIPEAEGFPRDIRAKAPDLSAAAKDRICSHFEHLERESFFLFSKFAVPSAARKSIELRTCNTFPMGSGIASSASSFSAMTAAFLCHLASGAEGGKEKFMQCWTTEKDFKSALALLSSQGSGSSGRSFFGPWVKWDILNAAEDNLVAFEPVKSDLPPVTDLVIVVSQSEKKVSSSEAHRRVKTSPLWTGRPERVRGRFERALKNISDGNFLDLSLLSAQESWEMHCLFHTAAEGFSYIQPRTKEILDWFKEETESDSEKDQISPLLTLDAGPNVHVLLPDTEVAKWNKKLSEKFGDLTVLIDTQGKGVEIV